MHIKTTMKYHPHLSEWLSSKRIQIWDFLVGPVVESSFQCRGCDSVPGQGTKITHAAEQPSLCATTTEPTHSRAHAPQQDRSACLNKDLAQPKLHIYKKRTPITNVLEENPYSLLARM